ncbi:MAG: biopolymer transporter ExbD [Deltaproteobacteria bacterium]|jgi:biopolymer transport protein TolR|nr:biopolymer transporter ExbD [Deltaproteobacteria bacterium]
MGMLVSTASHKKNFVSEINVTPFVDVMLVLLIIFMVTAPLLTEGLEVELPVTKEVQSLPADAENLVLSVTHAGRLYLGQTEVQMENLDKVLRQTVTDQHKQLFLQADKNVPYGLVVEVMGQAKAAGIENLGVVAQRPEEGRKR